MASSLEIDPLNKRRRRQPVRLIDRMDIFVSRVELWFSTYKLIDGLWIGTWERDSEFLLRRVEKALDLIKTHDRVRYDRVTRDLERVWVRRVFGYVAQYSPAMNACELDVRFVLDPASSSAIIAASIIHEAAHARIMHRGIEYTETVRRRIEAACIRRELAFAKKLPDGLEVRDLAEGRLERCAAEEFWTNASFGERDVEGAMEAARDVGMPMWAVKMVLAAAKLASLVRRRLRRFLKR